jgi:energy-coupling factor transport system permease protein
VQLVPVFIRAGLEISEAQACRGLDLSSGSIPERIRKSMALAVPLFMHAVRQANWLTIALEVRGFAPGAMRTTYQEYRFTRTDYVVLVVFSTALLVGVVCRILGVGVLLPTRL